MFTEREYQVKDIMKLYGISRDTIKYYESHGLIQSKRKENGYRVFDEMTVHKLKKILDFRDLGMSVQEVLQHCNSNSIAERTEVVVQVRHRLEEEIRTANIKLNKLRDLERRVSENFRYSDGFNVGHDVTLCVDCPQLSPSEWKSSLVASCVKGKLSTSGELQNLQECKLVRSTEMRKDCCRNCKNKQHFKQYYRSRIIYTTEERLKETVHAAVADMKLLGCHCSGDVFMLRKVLKIDGADTLILDTLIPFEKGE